MKLPNALDVLGKLTASRRKRVEEAVQNLWVICGEVAEEASADRKEELAIHAVCVGQAMRLLLHSMQRANPKGHLVLLASLNAPEAIEELAAKVLKAQAGKVQS